MIDKARYRLETLVCPICGKRRPNDTKPGEFFTHLCPKCRRDAQAGAETICCQEPAPLGPCSYVATEIDARRGIAVCDYHSEGGALASRIRAAIARAADSPLYGGETPAAIEMESE